MAKINFIDKVENEGASDEGIVFAVDMNQIKTVVNTNEDLRLGQTPISGVYSTFTQSIVFRNAANATVFSVSLSDLVVGGGGGIGDVYDPTKAYVRMQGYWVESTLYTDAPSNTKYYGRKGGNWEEFVPGVPEALDDGQTYARKNKGWVALGSGGSVSMHNDLSGRTEASCHPISSISELQTTLAGKAALAGSIDQDFSAKILNVGNSIVLNGRTLTIRTL